MESQSFPMHCSQIEGVIRCDNSREDSLKNRNENKSRRKQKVSKHIKANKSIPKKR
jgi:hypothetical protein